MLTAAPSEAAVRTVCSTACPERSSIRVDAFQVVASGRETDTPSWPDAVPFWTFSPSAVTPSRAVPTAQ